MASPRERYNNASKGICIMEYKGQLTFADIPEEIMLNPSVELPDEIRLEGYCKSLYHLFIGRRNLRKMYPEALLVSTAELMEYAKAQYNARLRELRIALLKVGWCIDRVSGEGGQFFYDLVPKQESTYYKKRKNKLDIELRP